MKLWKLCALPGQRWQVRKRRSALWWKKFTGATGTAGTNAQEVLANLAGEIGRINDGGKYDAELENLTNAIETANTALDAAKNMYACKCVFPSNCVAEQHLEGQ